jgi:hypothetical protein
MLAAIGRASFAPTPGQTAVAITLWMTAISSAWAAAVLASPGRHA